MIWSLSKVMGDRQECIQEDISQQKSKTLQSHIYGDSVKRQSSHLIGHKKELQKILLSISPDYRQHITVVEGINGIGKTQLIQYAVDICRHHKDSEYHYVEIPRFEKIVFTSIKQSYPNRFGRSDLPEVEPTLQKIFRNIANELKDGTILKVRTEEQPDTVYKSLKKQTTLLVIDNLEILDSKDRKRVLSFLADLPYSTQAIITTRQWMESLSSIQINELSKQESFSLLDFQAESKGIKLTFPQKKNIYNRFKGIPAALVYAVGRKVNRYSNHRTLGLSSKISEFPGDLVHLSFEISIFELRHTAAYKLLLALGIFQDAPIKDALIAVAGLVEDAYNVDEDLEHLEKLSLIKEENGRYHILSTTREYIIAELAKYSSFEQEARSRWIDWYVKFTEQYGGKDWENWREKFDSLDSEKENIFSVLYWCAFQDLYYDAQALWENIDTYVDLYGYWQIRQYWWQWLIKEANRRADIPTYVQALSEQAWTLTLMGKSNQNIAASKLVEAFKYSEYADLKVQSRLFCHIAVHRLIKQKYQKALNWLEITENFLNESHLTGRGLDREKLYIKYHKAEIIYWQWDKTRNQSHQNIDCEELLRSKKLFQEVLNYAKTIKWERFANYTQCWLGKILIDENKYNDALTILKEGLIIAENNEDTRRVAYFKKNICIVYQEYGDRQYAKKLAEEALANFKQEGMYEEIEKTEQLLDSLSLE